MPTILERHRFTIAGVASLVLVGAIAFVLLGPKLIQVGGLHISTLPRVNAVLSGMSSVTLLLAWRAVRRRRIPLHRKLMLTALGFTTLFLVSYLVQHGSFPSVKYGGSLGWIYYPMLISHIVLAAVIVPMVLLTLINALSGRFDRHRKIARWTLPLWLYVSITGVLVYVMCAPYY